ncbi:hypothetical protein PMAYCL1PPCAC_01172, partial [Pristionchus mayeri]
RRALWVNAVRSTPEGQKLLMAQLNETMMPLLCKSHFRPSDLDHFGSVPKLKHDAVPFFQVNESILSNNVIMRFLSSEECFDTMNENDPLYISNEVREDPLDVKDEPIDDFSDFNHEEPIADMYCPSTGLSRPLDQSAPLLSSKIPSKTTVSAEYKCIVCHLRQRHAKMRVFSSHPTRRALWVNTVRSTPEGQKLLMAQLN